jgi:hypothetical protein
MDEHFRGHSRTPAEPTLRPLVTLRRAMDGGSTLAWLGEDAARMEVARVKRHGDALKAEGTQLGSVYEVRYRLESELLSVELVGERTREVQLGDADFFDLGYSPLFNSLPVMRDHLLESANPHTYVMCWVDVPSLEVQRSEQRYEHLGRGVIRYRSGSFTADICFDPDGFVVNYPGLARRV